MRAALLLAFPAALGACSPALQCQMAATRDARSLDRQISDTRRDIARGYATIPTVGPFIFAGGPCVGPHGRYHDCAGGRFDFDSVDYVEVPINEEAERAKLASLEAQRARIEPRTQAALAACPQQ